MNLFEWLSVKFRWTLANEPNTQPPISDIFEVIAEFCRDTCEK